MGVDLYSLCYCLGPSDPLLFSCDFFAAGSLTSAFILALFHCFSPRSTLNYFSLIRSRKLIPVEDRLTHTIKYVYVGTDMS